MWDNAQVHVSERWAINKKGGSGGYNTSTPISNQYFSYQAWQENYTFFLDIIRVFSLSNERMRNTSWQIVVAMLHGLYIRHRNCVIYGYFFCVYRSEMLCAHLQVHVCTAVLRSAKRAPANVRRLNNISDVLISCSVGEHSRALALLNAAQDQTFLTSFTDSVYDLHIGCI